MASGSLASHPRRSHSAIESLIYQPQVRRAFGLRVAGLAYVLVGYGTNTLYSRLRLTTPGKTAVLAALGAACRLWMKAWSLAADLAAGGTVVSAASRSD